MDKIIISVETLNQILGYLGTRPYQEVFKLIDAVQKEALDQPKAPEETPPAE